MCVGTVALSVGMKKSIRSPILFMELGDKIQAFYEVFVQLYLCLNFFWFNFVTRNDNNTNNCKRKRVVETEYRKRCAMVAFGLVCTTTDTSIVSRRAVYTLYHSLAPS